MLKASSSTKTTSFYITYALLVTTGTITFIESLRTPVVAVRHIMNLETCISIVAAYFYSIFIAQLQNGETTMADLALTRYVDWTITTPLMLLSLLLAFSYNNGGHVRLSTYALIVALNGAMLWVGYAGERGTMDRRTATLAGFAAFAALFACVWYAGVRGSRRMDNFVLFGIFLGVWGLYGVAYNMGADAKQTAYNALDAVSKCLTGIGLWAYYTKTLTL